MVDGVSVVRAPMPMEILDKALDALAERWQPFPLGFEAVV